jgi:hypothetical protein
MKGLALFALSVMLIACGRDHAELPIFDLEAAMNGTLKASDSFTLNDIVEVVDIIPIETPPDKLIGSARLVGIDKNYCYVVDDHRMAIMLIDHNGQIVNSIAKVGRGPGEYLRITGVDINEKNSTIRIFDDLASVRYITYDMNGNSIDEGLLSEKGVGSPLFIADDYMIVRGRPEGAFRLYITDREMDIQKGLFPMDNTIYSEMERNLLIRQTTVGFDGDAALINLPTCDTVYRVTKQGVTPELIVDKGGYRMTDDDVFSLYDPTSNPFEYHKLRSTTVRAAGDYYFVQHMVFGLIQEIWSKSDCRLVARTDSRYDSEQYGFKFAFPTGVTTLVSTLFIDGDTMGFVVPAVAIAGSVDGVQEDDNPVIVIGKLKKIRI